MAVTRRRASARNCEAHRAELLPFGQLLQNGLLVSGRHFYGSIPDYGDCRDWIRLGVVFDVRGIVLIQFVVDVAKMRAGESSNVVSRPFFSE
jgi:hypothetical protein